MNIIDEHLDNVVQEENSTLIELHTEIPHTSGKVSDNVKVKVVKLNMKYLYKIYIFISYISFYFICALGGSNYERKRLGEKAG